MDKHLTTLFLVLICIVFSLSVYLKNNYHDVLFIYSPTKLGIDLDKDRNVDSNENICVAGIEEFSMNPSDEFVNKYSKSLDISRKDIISLGYLAQEFAQNNLTNAQVKLEFTGQNTSECHYANVLLNNYDYGKMLFINNFALKNGKVANVDGFKQNLEKARKLNLVILNHHSGKFHTLDCPYGKVAHDVILIPESHLPNTVKPCKYCHVIHNKKYHKDTAKVLVPNMNVPQPPLKLDLGDVKFYVTDFSKNLIPSKSCNNSVCKEVIHLIDGSKVSIDMALYGYSDIPAITQALQKAKSRGVKIRYVYDENSEGYSYYDGNDIIKSIAKSFVSDGNFGSRASKNYLMHNKFLVIDNSIILSGSMNFSSTGISGYDVNDIIVIKSKAISEYYTEEFEQMLNGKFHTSKVKNLAGNKFNVSGIDFEIYFSPKDKSSVRIIQIIKNAKKYIYVPSFLITHKDISEALINAQNRGVDVRIIIDANSVTTRNSQHTSLRSAGILLKTENYAGKLHSKMMIIDDEYLITGSMNFSNSGENKNDENLLIIKNSEIAKFHKNFFLYLWTIIPNKYLKYNAKPEGKDSIGSCFDGVDNNFNGKIDKQESICR